MEANFKTSGVKSIYFKPVKKWLELIADEELRTRSLNKLSTAPEFKNAAEIMVGSLADAFNWFQWSDNEESEYFEQAKERAKVGDIETMPHQIQLRVSMTDVRIGDTVVIKDFITKEISEAKARDAWDRACEAQRQICADNARMHYAEDYNDIDSDSILNAPKPEYKP